MRVRLLSEWRANRVGAIVTLSDAEAKALLDQAMAEREADPIEAPKADVASPEPEVIEAAVVEAPEKAIKPRARGRRG